MSLRVSTCAAFRFVESKLCKTPYLSAKALTQLEVGRFRSGINGVQRPPGMSNDKWHTP